MADRMEFPKTIKEFIDSYSFKDREEIYTNGAELIPVFRVEQAMEHYNKQIRNEAITEFAEALKADVMAKTFGLNCRDVDRIAKEMRGAE